nr:hypothetical protein Iba_chr03cCG4840 [Ipomoea batatas]GMD00009.1 hypothetical protein Iba_chr05eCG11110 [Ipomoea batatas]GME00896.1 hypothetical protein Iba_scaffold480144CG0010 [Ipomoea batatas]
MVLPQQHGMGPTDGHGESQEQAMRIFPEQQLHEITIEGRILSCISKRLCDRA